ncbi:MAG: hypothetical protein BWY71_01078 [Planctomycetes bacterium ADurb.Bin412]|nr:MAG: hypothetical protein BWY71_01078 [Planctomycetes bacterium ADurb.Bin412]
MVPDDTFILTWGNWRAYQGLELILSSNLENLFYILLRENIPGQMELTGNIAGINGFLPVIGGNKQNTAGFEQTG